jgi:hypothetical protein
MVLLPVSYLLDKDRPCRSHIPVRGRGGVRGNKNNTIVSRDLPLVFPENLPDPPLDPVPIDCLPDLPGENHPEAGEREVIFSVPDRNRWSRKQTPFPED